MTAVESHAGLLRVLDTTGDTRVAWDTKSDPDVANAKKHFDDLSKRGYRGFAVRPDGTKSLITEFDPYAGEIIMTPPIVGG